MKTYPPQKVQKATNPSTGSHWNEMNRKQRCETMRKIQSEDLSLKVVHPHAAGIDIGNDSYYVAVRPSRDSGCTAAELKAMADWRKQCGNSDRRLPTNRTSSGLKSASFWRLST
jgi:hypothetical protein